VEKGEKRARRFSLVEIIIFLVVAGFIWWLVNSRNG